MVVRDLVGPSQPAGEFEQPADVALRPARRGRDVAHPRRPEARLAAEQRRDHDSRRLRHPAPDARACAARRTKAPSRTMSPLAAIFCRAATKAGLRQAAAAAAAAASPGRCPEDRGFRRERPRAARNRLAANACQRSRRQRPSARRGSPRSTRPSSSASRSVSVAGQARGRARSRRDPTRRAAPPAAPRTRPADRRSPAPRAAPAAPACAAFAPGRADR